MVIARLRDAFGRQFDDGALALIEANLRAITRGLSEDDAGLLEMIAYDFARAAEQLPASATPSDIARLADEIATRRD
ncbi:hypothetical protein ACO2Q0_20905 [Phenylobacterium sp. VNQ135]|uniref:hypothetical protein n=1 Tax=Phenylobacterium sp. VNQ135 TaxID=3400922 RepID=UPI003BFDB466